MKIHHFTNILAYHNVKTKTTITESTNISLFDSLTYISFSWIIVC